MTFLTRLPAIATEYTTLAPMHGRLATFVATQTTAPALLRDPRPRKLGRWVGGGTSPGRSVPNSG